MHPFPIIVIFFTVLFVYLLVSLFRGWKAQETEMNAEFLVCVGRYAERYGKTESGQRFLADIGANARARLNDPTATALSAAAATGVWTKALGGSTESSITGGLISAAATFVFDGIAKFATNRGKTKVQIADEEAIAELIFRFHEKKKSSSGVTALLVASYSIFVSVYIGWLVID